nr:MAG TPA: hypothetical protein [Caudoviricetes sp.]
MIQKKLLSCCDSFFYLLQYKYIQLKFATLEL